MKNIELPFWKYRFSHTYVWHNIPIRNENRFSDRKVNGMKGYFVTDGYMGLVEGVYRLFADETDYYEYMKD